MVKGVVYNLLRKALLDSFLEKHKRKVFVSYYHKEDQEYRDKFEKQFGHLFISKSVEPGEIDSNISDEYIKRLIQEEYISDTSVLIVLIGQKTYLRKHVDWEISAALDKRVGNNYAGLIGLILPTKNDYGAEKSFNPITIPPRLYDNVKSGYAKIYDWTDSAENISGWIETAFKNRELLKEKIDNSREQYMRDLGD